LIAVILTLLAVGATFFDGEGLELHRNAEVWRFVTCHFTHWSYEQLAWDALAFLLLAWVCERRNRVAFHATLLASAIVIPLAVLAFAPNVIAYRGLSGLDSALFAMLIIEARRSRIAMLCGIAFVAKIVFELTTGSLVFVTHMGEGVAPVPIAHIAGAIVGAVTTFALRDFRRPMPVARPRFSSNLTRTRWTADL